jgi:hypothetical protein
MILLNFIFLSFNAMIRNEIPKNIPPICISDFISELKSAWPTVEGMIFVLD